MKGHLRTSSQSGTVSGPATDRLNSWKEIAVFFDKDVRTVRRWEAVRKLPVHRMPGGGRSGVFAYVSELQQWLTEADSEGAGLETAMSPGSEEAESGSDSGEYEAMAESSPAAGQGNVVPAATAAVPASFLRRHAFSALAVMALFVVAVAAFALWHRHGIPASTELAEHGKPGKPSSNPEAQELYLRGIYQFNQRTEASLTEAVDLFTQAIVRDPHFAAGYAGLADSYVLLRQYGHMPDGEAFPRALAASRQALALDDTSPQAHRAYAFILNYWMWNFPEAEKEFQRSIELSPDDAQTHSWYATSLFSVGHYQEAVREIDTARRLQPDSIAILCNRGLLLSRVDENASLSYLAQLEKVNPNFPNAHEYLSLIEFDRRDYRDGLDESHTVALLRNDANEAALVERFQQKLAEQGPQATLAMMAENYGRLVDAGRGGAMQPAGFYAQLGDKERALHYLKLAGDRHEAEFPRIALDKQFPALLAGDPQYQRLVALSKTPMDLQDALKTRQTPGGSGLMAAR